MRSQSLDLRNGKGYDLRVFTQSCHKKIGQKRCISFSEKNVISWIVTKNRGGDLIMDAIVPANTNPKDFTVEKI